MRLLLRLHFKFARTLALAFEHTNARTHTHIDVNTQISELTHTHRRTHTRNEHSSARTNARTHRRKHTNMRTRTHPHTHIDEHIHKSTHTHTRTHTRTTERALTNADRGALAHTPLAHASPPFFCSGCISSSLSPSPGHGTESRRYHVGRDQREHTILQHALERRNLRGGGSTR